MARQNAGMGLVRLLEYPSPAIEKLAHEMALSTPAYHVQGWGIQRQANGEQACRSVFMPAILTGQVGIHGGSTGAREGGYSIPFASFPTLQNPVETSISVFMWTDAIYRATEMTALADGVQGQRQTGCTDQVHLELRRQLSGQPAFGSPADRGSSGR